MSSPDSTTPGPSRRQVLCGVAVGILAPGALAAACGQSGSGMGSGGSSGQSGGGAAGGPSAGGASGGPLAALSDVPVGGGKLVDRPDGSKVLLVRTSQNEVKGFDPTCPHVGVKVSPPQGGVITCPGHGSQFDAASGALRKGPATKGLTPIPVKVEGQQIVAA